MKKYKWDLYRIRNNIEILQNLYNNETDAEKQIIISEFIEMYKNMISLISKNKSSNNELLNDCLSYDSMIDLIEEQINSYQINDINIINMILKSYLPFREVYNGDYILKNPTIISTNEDLVNVANDFFIKMTPNNISKKFIELIENNSNSINFSYTKRNDNYAGITLFDSILNKKYIYISKTNKLIDLVTLPHEAFHYLFNDNNVYLVNDYNTYYTTEIEGGFANILFGDYFYNNSIENKNFFNQYFLEVYHSGISEIVIKNSFLDSIKNNKKIRMNKFNKTLDVFELIPFTDEIELVEYMDNPLEINLKYSLGYLVAIDLYYIYKKDPELAFYLLKNLKFIKQENNITSMLRRNHITFMDDGYENLKKYIKKIERQG